jgi:hypothetical protein
MEDKHLDNDKCSFVSGSSNFKESGASQTKTKMKGITIMVPTPKQLE